MQISAGGGAELPKLAPDLTSFTDREPSGATVNVSGIDATGSLTTLLSLTGAFLIDILYIGAMATNDLDQITLTIDGVVIWNEDGLSDNIAAHNILGNLDGDHGHQIRCDASLLFQVEMSSDNLIDLIYKVRPLL